MINHLYILLTATAKEVCEDTVGHDCSSIAFQWSCVNNCETVQNCKGTCVDRNLGSCFELYSRDEALCIKNRGMSGVPGVPTCNDDPSYDCDGQAWGYNCGAPGYCETMQKCQKTCIDRGYQPSCDVMKTETDRVCGGGAGGAPSAPTSGCERSYGYKGFIGTDNKFISDRDGVVSLSGDYITVVEERPTPSWCRDPTVSPPAKGWTGHWKDYYHLTGLHKLACVGWTESKHIDATCTSGRCAGCDTNKYPEKSEVFSYDAFAQATGYFAEFAGYDNWEQSALDLAAFVSHSTKETMGDTPTAENGWCWIGEMGYDSAASPSCNYGCVDGTNNNDVCSDGSIGTSLTATPPPEYSNSAFKSWNGGYWGRGSIQLSYCYNYMYFTDWVENGLLLPKTPETDFFTNPGMVGTKDWAFAAGLWFYMSPSSDGIKPSMHSMVDFWGPNDLVVDNKNRPADFGYQVNILNGGIECSGDYHYAHLRQESMNIIMRALDFPNSVNGSYLHMPELQIAGCEGEVLGYTPHEYWTINGTQCSGDSINTCADDESDACQTGPEFTGNSGSVNPSSAPTAKPTNTPTNAPTPPAGSDFGNVCCGTPMNTDVNCGGINNASQCGNTNFQCIWVPQEQCTKNVCCESPMNTNVNCSALNDANACGSTGMECMWVPDSQCLAPTVVPPSSAPTVPPTTTPDSVCCSTPINTSVNCSAINDANSCGSTNMECMWVPAVQCAANPAPPTTPDSVCCSTPINTSVNCSAINDASTCGSTNMECMWVPAGQCAANPAPPATVPPTAAPTTVPTTTVPITTTTAPPATVPPAASHVCCVTPFGSSDNMKDYCNGLTNDSSCLATNWSCNWVHVEQCLTY